MGILAAVLLGLSLYHFVYSCDAAIARGVVDFPIFLRHAEHFLQTGTLYVYADDLTAYQPASPVYKFPPLYAALLLPLVRNGIHDSVYYYHWGLQILLYLVAAGLAAQILRGSRPSLFFVAAGLLAWNFEPFFETLWRLQIETPLLLLLAVALWGLRRGRDGVAGVALGVAVMLKIYPAFLLAYLVVRRRWRAIAFCAATMVLVQLLMLAIFGLHENQVFFTRILPTMLGEGPVVDAENLGMGRYFQQWFALGPAAAKRLGQVVTLLLLGSALCAVERNRRAGVGREATGTELSLFIALMVFSLPNSWVNYQLLLLIPYLALLSGSIEVGAPRGYRLGALGAVGAFLLLFYAPCADPATVSWPCAETPRFLGLLALPRGFHDAMVSLRVLGSLLPVLGLLALLLRVPFLARR
jgi:hypothetical protein